MKQQQTVYTQTEEVGNANGQHGQSVTYCVYSRRASSDNTEDHTLPSYHDLVVEASH